jgi:hypothetical protein
VSYYGPGFFHALNRMAMPIDALRGALRGFSMGGLVDAVSTPLMPPMRFADGGMVPELAAAGGGGSPIYLTFPSGATVGPMMADRQVSQAMEREGRRAAMLSAGKRPSTA